MIILSGDPAETKTKNINQLEFWISTTLYILAVIGICTSTSYGTANAYRFIENHISYSRLSNFFLPEIFKISILYISFLLINFCFMPQLAKKNNIVLNVVLTVIVTGVSVLIWMVANTYSQADRLIEDDDIGHAYDILFGEAFTYIFLLYLLFNIYAYFSEKGMELLEKLSFLKSFNSNIKLEIFTSIKIWLITLMVFAVVFSPTRDYEIVVICLIAPPVNIIFVFLSIYYTIPNLRKIGKGFGRYFWGNVAISAMICLLLLLLLVGFMRNGPAVPIALILTSISLICISTPLAWYIYKHKFEKQTEIQMLKTELGKSDASLNFLKSQINPHFLFNALNTLFGTALQEKAERTGEGIQKLGDMMRFMLHENTQDKISLTREVEYLNNYIDLQKLRTSRSADISIDSHIEEQLNNLQITPMLLIPFIENAFKHGISLQQPSYIKMTLQTKESTLYFDVSNSIYIKADNDPEKLKSGIGLENVKQRLALLYHGKHELIIRESANEFFVHLTLQLG
ncbi:GHKL domain-containing protein [Pedobacter frigidisoli]|uniref:GHKL domain-containing protein n=1 Tax=Pedobacter frigidisoli TaxID=2530455 RepID=A0A4R0NN43_9SPHI|nr:histidine kinase [Pedobacter frigidisoli]TCD00555.1 GHKL domain-containing protein [Pedobacter frigidisoli]